MIKKILILYYVFGAIFLLGIALSFISMWLHPRNSEDMNYEERQPELFTHEDISAVLIRDDLQQIYVCYNDAAHVNTYNASGEFLWAVATPYSGNVDFVLLENNLVIDGSEYAYIYNAESGTFVAKKNTDEVLWERDFDDEYSGTPAPGDIYFDSFQVYKIAEDGSEVTLVARPYWYRFVNPLFFMLFTFAAAIGIIVLIVWQTTADYRNVQRKYTVDGQRVTLRHPRARFIQKYFKVVSIVHLAYAFLDIIFGIFLDGILCIGIVPLTLHLIVSNVVFTNILNQKHLTDDENKIMNYWTFAQIVSFIIAVASVFVAAALN